MDLPRALLLASGLCTLLPCVASARTPQSAERGATSPSEDLDARGWERLPAGPPLEGLEEEDLTGWRGGLVLEAETGKPLAGARLRVFREDWYDPLEPLLPLVTTFTGRDGAFTLFAGDPRFEGAEKLLLDAPGRRSLEVPLGEAWGELFLLEPETALEVEVRDLEGRPIAGAVLKTTTTCSHAPPAWHALTSRFGLASLAAAPSVHDAGDLDLEADGHQAVADRSVHDGWAWSARTGTFTLFLAPQARMQVCALRADGTPVPEGWRLVRQSDGPWRVARVGSGGRASFRSPGGPPGSASLWIAPPRAFEPREWIPSPARHAGELLRVFRQTRALHALMLQIRVKTKAFCRQRFARNLGHRAQHGTRLLKGEARVAFGACQWHQRQGSAHFDTESAAVAKKQTREVRAKVPHKRRRVLLARRAGLDQFAFPRDHAH